MDAIDTSLADRLVQISDAGTKRGGSRAAQIQWPHAVLHDTAAHIRNQADEIVSLRGQVRDLQHRLSLVEEQSKAQVQAKPSASRPSRMTSTKSADSED